ncbi:MAG: DUF2934 domain-containing protein [Proteobacteria bacterium]|nr:DUF2934 domain-containing protein [Pseudomonadota bacterium]
MVEEKKKPAAKKAVAKKAPAVKAIESAVWPFPETEKAAKKAPVKKATVAEPATAKPATKPAVKKAAAPKARPAAKQEVAQPSAQERYRMVETAAYYIAERSGFQGCTTDHWAAAEIEIAAKLTN